ncbi:MAG: DUF1207 domain-containing protein [Planctomycetales bacterium]|nr:DUF1207 domain-containing protein [Planctomycetales bacterium]
MAPGIGFAGRAIVSLAAVLAVASAARAAPPGAASGPPTTEEPAALEWFPRGLLYPRPRADLRRPRTALRFLSSPRFHRPQLETAVGGEWAFARWRPQPTGDTTLELAGFGGEFMDFAMDDDADLRSTDGVWGALLGARDGPLSVKLEFQHLSSHRGDETILEQGQGRLDYVRNDLAFGAAWQPQPGLRVYGELAYGVSLSGPARAWRMQGGVEIPLRALWADAWPVVLAVDANSRQEVHYNVSVHVELGLDLWTDGAGRTARAGLGWFRGKDPATQYYDRQVQSWGLSFTLDW